MKAHETSNRGPDRNRVLCIWLLYCEEVAENRRKKETNSEARGLFRFTVMEE